MIAKEKFKPDYFLYENNKSAAQAIKNQISHELGVDLQYINSALVSAQNRQRFYAHNIPNVEQPEDRGILLKDILESGTAWKEKSYCLDANYYKATNGTNAFNGKQSGKRLCVAEPVRIGTISNNSKNKTYDSQQYRVYSTNGKFVTICGQGGGVGAKTGLYTCPIDKNMKKQNIYEVHNGLITIQDKQYPIKLSKGHYIIRKLTPIECERLQTLPDNYTAGISNTQRYKCIGNGWTAEVIIHILNYLDIPKDEPIEVLSMYDGIGTGKYCFDKLGYKNIA